ncbi:MAG: glycosyltransferase [Ardenticatenaceae bacterium]|nr:glycosyltransferase [Anaerolineales bacterium]MCB8979052.1 glycosyltransferase [Ardenticatenaceae bacterium]
MNNLILILYYTALGGLALYGLFGLLTLALYWRHRHEQFPTPPLPADLPTVTVQLPVFNEPFVVERLIHTAVSLHYPADKLQIQVIDDSTDSTTERAARWVAYYKEKGINISLLHRNQRSGFKAGALAEALTQASGAFIAIFDADFQPQPDFLQQTIPHFGQNPALGMVQTRWGHLNDGRSPLTGAQAIALDKHFAMEQTVRHRANLFPKFNGAGGVWRRSCLEDAGGWHSDTVCEDMCLSTRAVLRQWECLFLNEVQSPAELPTTISAYKSQQARWSKGSSQCLLKYGRTITTAREHTLLARFYALMSMSAYTTNLLLILLLLLQIPLLLLDIRFSPWLLLFSVAGVGQPLLFVMSQQVLYRDWLRRLRHFPTMVLVAIGMAPSNSRAILQAVFSRDHDFVRTPKQGSQAQSPLQELNFDWIMLVELALALYAWMGVLVALYLQNHGPLFFLLTCALAYTYMITLNMREWRWHWQQDRQETAVSSLH